MIVCVRELLSVGLALVGAFGFASTAHAQAEATPLTYAAPSTCPSREQFEGAVRARTPLARFGESADAPRRFSLQATSARGRVTAILKVTSRDGSVTDRQFEGETCTEVIDALALVTALAIDPKASTAPLAVPLAPAAAPPSGVAATPRAPVRAVSPPPPHPTAVWEASVGAAAEGVAGVTPSPLLGAALFGAVEQKAAGWWAPSLRLTLGAAETFEGSTARADFALGTVGVDFCPSVARTTALSLRACVEADVGLLHARGLAVSTPGSADRFWLDVRVESRARWSPGGGRVFVEIEVGVLLPITRPTFVFRTPRVVVQEVSSVAPVARIGVGLRFP